jgi:hypothetical protein
MMLDSSAKEREGVWQDVQAAKAYAAMHGKKVVLWVGSPTAQAVKDTPEAVHVQVKEYAGSKEPRAIVETNDGHYYLIDGRSALDQVYQLRFALHPPQTSAIYRRVTTVNC